MEGWLFNCETLISWFGRLLAGMLNGAWSTCGVHPITRSVTMTANSPVQIALDWNQPGRLFSMFSILNTSAWVSLKEFMRLKGVCERRDEFISQLERDDVDRAGEGVLEDQDS